MVPLQSATQFQTHKQPPSYLKTIMYRKRFLIRSLNACLLLTLLALGCARAEESVELSEKTIFGWIENVYLQPYNLKAKAKLDTGAKTSSIHAKNIEHFERDGDPWVRFQFSSNTRLKESAYLEGKSKKIVTIEAPITRSALIKNHRYSSVERPVVSLPITLAGVEHRAEFTLTDRKKFLYPVLLGRRFLKDVAIVDPGNTFLRTRTTPRTSAQESKNQGKATAERSEPDSQNTPPQQ